MHLADVLGNVLPCYTRRADRPRPDSCAQRGAAGQLDAVFIEGHTDNVALAGYGQFRDNWDLSTARAKAIYNGLTSRQPDLDLLLNQHEQPVLGVSGYADRRRVAENDSDDNRRKNRRIDLRFVMVPAAMTPPRPAEETRKELS
jgi:outer membrane protein OmpA-like peptidoglycan-associated protein